MKDYEAVSRETYLSELERRHGPFRLDTSSLRRLFSPRDQVFFDCFDRDVEECLRKMLEATDMDQFLVFYLAREKPAQGTEVAVLREAVFKNISNETIPQFEARFRRMLERVMRLSVESAGFEYLECVGFSYTTQEDFERLLSQASALRQEQKRLFPAERRAAALEIEQDQPPGQDPLRPTRGILGESEMDIQLKLNERQKNAEKATATGETCPRELSGLSLS